MMLPNDLSAQAAQELREEARHLHRALFGEPPPPAVEEGYISAHRYYCREGSDQIKVRAIVSRRLDVEALELVLRGSDPVLTRKIRVLFYLAEVLPSRYPGLVNQRDQPIRAVVALAGAVIRTVYKYLKGQLLRSLSFV